VSVLAALLTLGKVSDHIGRRPVLLTTLCRPDRGDAGVRHRGRGARAAVARVVQGLATGAALGAIGAAMLDVDPRRGTFVNAVSPGMGTATGALVSALAVRYLPAPTHLIYLVLLAVFAVQTLCVALMRETANPRARCPGQPCGRRSAAAHGSRTDAGGGSGAARRVGVGRARRRARPAIVSRLTGFTSPLSWVG